MADRGRCLTIGDVAGRLSVSVTTVRRWIRRRELAAVKLGGAVRVRERDLEEFLAARSTAGLEVAR